MGRRTRSVAVPGSLVGPLHLRQQRELCGMERWGSIDLLDVHACDQRRPQARDNGEV